MVESAVLQRQREELKSTQNAREREDSHIDEHKKYHHKAGSELQRATMDATKITRCLKETIDDFEKHKIRYIKKIFGKFVIIESLSCLMKPSELYTLACQSIQSVDEEADLEQHQANLQQMKREEKDDEEDSEDESEEESEDS